MSSDQPNGCEVDIIESDEEAPVAEDLVDASEEDHEGDEEQDKEQEEHLLSPGDIVWVKFNRRWTAARIVTLSDIPNTSLSRQLKSNNLTTSLVRFYHDETYHRASNSNIELLAQNLVDQSRARHYPAAYLEAVSDLCYG